MILRARALAFGLALAAAAPAALAAEDAPCAPAALAAVDAWLATHPWREGRTSPDLRVAAACKASPTDPARVIVAAAYGQGGSDFGDPVNFIAALVEPRGRHVRSTFTGSIPTDAAMALAPGSLHIDTARYDLAPGVRAFGVDVTSSAHGPSCPDGGFGPLRTLFVQDGAALRPVLASVELSSWQRLAGPACAWTEGQDDVVIQNTVTTIAVDPHVTHGFADLVLSGRVDGHVAPRLRAVLRYDGSKYVAKDDRIWPDVIVPDAAPAH